MRKIAIVLLTLLMPSLLLGQEVVLLKKPVSSKTVVKFMFKNGSIADPKGKEGLTVLTAALMMEGGTLGYTKPEIDSILYPMAAWYSASADKEVVVFTFEFPSVYQDAIFDIMMGLIVKPEFTEENFQRVKSNQLNYVEQVIKASSDEEYSKMALEEMLFHQTPYRHMVAGTVEGVKSISLADVEEHYRKYFGVKNVTTGVAGAFKDRYVEKIRQGLSQLPSHEIQLPELPAPQQPAGIRVRIIEKENALGSAIFAGFPIDVTREKDEFVALMVANSSLGEHRKSYGRLYQKIRETRSMNYGDYTYIEWYKDGTYHQLPPSGTPRSSNYFGLWIRPVQIGESLRSQYPELKDVSIGHAHFALRLAIREIDLLVKNGLTKEDFEATRRFLKNYIKLYIQSPEKELGFLMDSRFYNRRDFISEAGAILDRLTVDDVNAAVRKYLQTENMQVAIVTDDSEAAVLAKSLKENLPSPMTYANVVKEGLPGEVLDEDKEIENYKLNVALVEITGSAKMFIH